MFWLIASRLPVFVAPYIKCTYVSRNRHRTCAEFQMNYDRFCIELSGRYIPDLKLVLTEKHPRNRPEELWRNSCGGWGCSCGLCHQWGETDWLRSIAIQCQCSGFFVKVASVCCNIYTYIYSFKWICQVLYRVFWLIYSWFKIGHYIQETDSRRSDEIAVEDGSGAQVSVINEVRVTDSGALPFGVDILASCFKAACVCCTIYIVYLCMAEQTQKIENVQIFK